MEERYPSSWRRGDEPSAVTPWWSWPNWQEWRNWLEEIPWLGEGRAPRNWPNVDVYQTDSEVVVRADLPGVSPDNVDVRVSSNSLTLKGQMQQDEEYKQENAYRLERRYGGFLRTIPLPSQVDPEKATARFHQGILELHLPRTGADRGRRIPITPVQ